jgi:predicted ATPase/DNA-binding CsgD family transcriptional regulator
MAGNQLPSDTSLVEPLTRREREVLALLGQRLTSPEIAAELTLATSTVKWYIQQIYGKLGVNSRRQAIARARELGLLKDSADIDFQPGEKHNLPRQLTRFIGRESEIEQIKQLLKEHELVTLTGPGGVGKSRLSLRLAEDLLEVFQHGVWQVELASVSRPEGVVQAVAQTLGLREEANVSIQDSLIHYLGSRRMLLVLDNCEHLIAACAELAVQVLQTCPQMKVLATSREPLSIPGEAIYQLSPLALPDPEAQLSLQELSAYDALDLFVERARAALPSYSLQPENAAHIRSICANLDGIPLALELAAARMNVLDTAELDARLSDAFHVLTGGARTSLPRHRTLRAAIDWSYQLLSPEERMLLRRLSVFTGGWNMEDAESICAGEELDQAEVFDLLASLVSKSMVMTVRAEGRGTRYRLLDTIQQYAREKLAQIGEAELLCRLHAAHFFALVDRYAAAFNLPDELRLQKRIDENLPNLRSALDWALGGAAADQGVQAVLALWDVFYWGVHGMEEWRLWLEKAASHVVPNQPSLELARLRRHQGFYLEYQGQHEAAFARLMTSREMFAALGSELDYAKVTQHLGLASKDGEQPESWGRASAYFEESAAILRKLGVENWLAFVLSIWGNFETVIGGDHARALELLMEAESLYQKLGAHNHTYQVQGMVYLRLKKYERARQFTELALQLARGRGNQQDLMHAFYNLAYLEVAEAADLAGLRKAEGYLREGLELASKFPGAFEYILVSYIDLARQAQSLGVYEMAQEWFRVVLTAFQEMAGVYQQANHRNAVECLLGLAEVAASQDKPVECARLLGALAAFIEEVVDLRKGLAEEAVGQRKNLSQEDSERLANAVCGKLDEATFRQAWDQGQAMTFEQAVTLALEEIL